MVIPESGILVRLLPFHQPSPATPPPTASRFKNITMFGPYGFTAGGMEFNVNRAIKLYDDPSGENYKTIGDYIEKYDGRVVPDSVVATILTKYIDTTDTNLIKNGGRFSRKKYKKSFKQRGRSMKRYVSKSRKYRIRK